MSAGSIPDLSPEEVADLLRRLSLLTDEGGTVVVGGQAVHFWAWFFTARDLILDLVPPTSGDLDLCGTRSAVVRARWKADLDARRRRAQRERERRAQQAKHRRS